MKYLIIVSLLISVGCAVSIPLPDELQAKLNVGGSDSLSISSTDSSSLTEVDEIVIDPEKEYAAAIINELYYDAAGSDTNGELFVELLATTSGHLDYYQINFINGDNGAISQTLLLDGEFYVSEGDLFLIADALSGSEQTMVVGANYIVNFDPQNGPDGMQLLDNAGHLLDAVGYGANQVEFAENGLAVFEGLPTVDVSSASSISRLEEREDTNNNATDFVENLKPSPGKFEVLMVE